MSQTTKEQNTFRDDTKQLDVEPCNCDRKTCAIGITSVVIGIGGFILANIL